MNSSPSIQAATSVTAIAAGLLAVPLFAGLVWAVWRLVFWGIAAAAPDVRGVHPMHASMHGPGSLLGAGVFTTSGGAGIGTSSLFLLAVVVVALTVTVLVARSSPDAGVTDAADEVAARQV